MGNSTQQSEVSTRQSALSIQPFDRLANPEANAVTSNRLREGSKGRNEEKTF
jgi:hypothetical protein